MVLDVAPRQRSVAYALIPLGLVFFAVGIGAAVVGPFLALFLSTAVHASPLQVTVFLVAAPLSSVVSSTLIGRVSDRRPIRRKLVIGAATAGMVSMLLTSFIRDYWTLLALTVSTMALSGSLFPQTFAYARQVLARDDPSKAAMGISALRTVFSLAWVAGPALAALLLHLGGFTSLYGTAAVLYAVAALVGVFWLEEIGTPSDPAESTDGDPATGPDDGPEVPDDLGVPEVSRRTLLLTTAAFVLLHCPLTLGVQALPLFIKDDLHADVGNAGLILGLCAALEIPLMLGLGALATRVRVRVLVLIGAGCGVAYEALAATASGIWVLAAAQLLNAVYISGISGLGITYMQDMRPRHPGQATTLFTNCFPIGAMMAGPLLGLAQHFGFRLAYAMSMALCAIALLTLMVIRPRARAGADFPRKP
jgi:MFS transporter, SET family, sugar efflux transporter